MSLLRLERGCSRHLQKQPPSVDDIQECTFPSSFAPNPGGQQRFASLVGIEHPVNSDIRACYLRGGVGSGKSFVGAAFACGRALADGQSRGLITANSYGQLETSTLVALAEFCRAYNIPLEPAAGISRDAPEWPDETAKRIAARRLCTIFGAPVLVLSADAFTGTTEKAKERGRGLQIRWFWADEFSYADVSAFNTLNTRLGRGISGNLKGVGVITSSINKNNPYNWAYELFDAPNRDKSKQKKFVSIPLSTFENVHLDDDYVDSQAAALTDELYKIEILGEYAVVTSGAIYNTFSRDKHALFGADAQALQYRASEDLHISFDFNHSPATAIACQLKDELRVIKGWYILDSDTFQSSAQVAMWCQQISHSKRIYLYGDASGKSRRSSSRTTDWKIVWDAFRSRGFEPIRRYGTGNPKVRDSINSLKIALKEDWIYINGEDEPLMELIKDLEVLKWDGSGEIDKKDQKRSHMQDGLRYLVDTIRPYRGIAAKKTKPRGPVRGLVG
ncbi:MAG: terminase family protein [Cyanobacteria bacterium P01_D01_bin.115]